MGGARTVRLESSFEAVSIDVFRDSFGVSGTLRFPFQILREIDLGVFSTFSNTEIDLGIPAT